MARTLSWKWLFSPCAGRRARTVTPARPCLAALEQLEDRVLLSSALGTAANVPPLPLSNQSVNAIVAFLKLEGGLLKGQDTFIKIENAFMKESGNHLPAAVKEYFLKIDGDLIKIDNDLIGTDRTGGIDGVLVHLKLPVKTAIDLEARLIPAVSQELDATIAAKTQMGNVSTTGVRPAAVVDYFLKLDEVKDAAQAAASDLTVSFAKIEYQLIGADATNLGPALGLQGSATPGQAGGLLQDLVVLTSDSGRTLPAAKTGSTPPALEIFLKIEDAIIKGEDAFLKIEQTILKKTGGQLPTAAVDYFLKLDADLIQIDNDLIGASGANGGGIDGVLLKLSGLSSNVAGRIQNQIAAIQNERTAAMAAEKSLQGAQGTHPAAVDAFLKLDGIEGDAQRAAGQLSLNFAKIEYDFIKLDANNLGPALGLQGSATPGPAGGLLQDAVVLTSDAGGKFPGATVFPPPTVVDTFLKIENAIIQSQNDFLAAEQGFLDFLKLGVQLPAAAVDYFLKLNDAQIQIANDLIGSDGNGGIDKILIGLLLPSEYTAKIQTEHDAVLAVREAAIKAEQALGQNSGTPPTAAAVDFFLKLDGIQHKEQAALSQLSANFAKIEYEFIGLDPKNLGPALGPQGSPTPGPAGGLLQDLVDAAARAQETD